MYKLFTTLKNTVFLGHYNDHSYFLEDGFLKKNKISNTNWKSSDKGGFYFVYNTKVLISSSGPIKAFNISNGQKFYENEKLSIFHSGSYERILVDNNELDSRRLSLFDIVKNTIIWTIDFRRGPVNLVYNNSFVSTEFRNKSLLVAFSLIDGSELWRFNLNDITFEGIKLEINKIIGVWQNEIIVACSNYLLLSLDLKTGKIVRKWQELKKNEFGQSYKNVLPEPTDFVLDKDANKLVGVFHTYYFEIDLVSGNITYDNLIEELNNRNINSFRRMGDNPFTKDHLFVTGHAEDESRPDVDLDCLMVLNRNTKKLDWVYIFKDTGLGTNVPQLTEKNLYQLDLENTLYVFQLENKVV